MMHQERMNRSKNDGSRAKWLGSDTILLSKKRDKEEEIFIMILSIEVCFCDTADLTHYIQEVLNITTNRKLLRLTRVKN